MSLNIGEKTQLYSRKIDAIKADEIEAPAHAIRWLEKVLAASPEPAFFFEMQQHRLLAINYKLVKLLGFAWEELLAKRVEDLMPMGEIPRLQKSLKQEPSPASTESRYLHKDGRTLVVRLYYREHWYVDSDKRERAIRLVIITNAGATHLHESELPPLPFVAAREGQLRRVAWLKRLAVSG